jgi:hypothetical protein
MVFAIATKRSTRLRHLNPIEREHTTVSTKPCTIHCLQEVTYLRKTRPWIYSVFFINSVFDMVIKAWVKTGYCIIQTFDQQKEIFIIQQHFHFGQQFTNVIHKTSVPLWAVFKVRMASCACLSFELFGKWVLVDLGLAMLIGVFETQRAIVDTNACLLFCFVLFGETTEETNKENKSEHKQNKQK